MKTFLKGKRFKSKTKIFCSDKFSGLVYNKLLVVNFYFKSFIFYCSKFE